MQRTATVRTLRLTLPLLFFAFVLVIVFSWRRNNAKPDKTVTQPPVVTRTGEKAQAESMRTMTVILALLAAVLAIAVVYNGARVALAERSRDLQSEFDRLALGERPLALDQRLQVLAVDVLEHDELASVLLAAVDHRDDVGVRELRHGARLD